MIGIIGAMELEVSELAAAMEEAKAELENEEKEMKEYLEDKSPVFHKTEE